MQVPGQNLQFRSSGHLAVAATTDVGSVDRVARGVFTAVRPVEEFSDRVDF